MRLLLDTHVLVWSQETPERLRKPVAAELDDPANETWCSPLSFWELGSLIEKHRITAHVDLPAWVAALAARHRLREAPLTTGIVLAAGAMHFDHRDPVDRFLAATAKICGLTLVTADARLLRRTDIATLQAA